MSEKTISPPPPEMKIDTTQIKSSYCNVCSATSTKEEVVMTFGINQNWDLRQQPMEVSLQHRVIMSPAAAKRFHGVLSDLLTEHETRHGSI
ncbi:MAG: DUF3467 domain-containing protein [Paracraurococcus sp.]